LLLPAGELVGVAIDERGVETDAVQILNNPKYTGYQVWNRRATKKGGCHNDPKEWVWSPQPTHEPLITRDLFDQATLMSAKRQGSRTTAGTNSHPAARRSYALRSYVRCDICARRMHGKTRHNILYYACQPDSNEHRDEDWYRLHPRGLWVREEILLTAVGDFFADRIFGPQRRAHLRTTLEAASQDPGHDSNEGERSRLEQAIATLEGKQARLIQTLAEGVGGNDDGADPEPERAFRNAIRSEHATLERQRQALRQLLTDLSAPTTPQTHGGDPALLDALPRLDIRVENHPEAIQRQLYDAFGLEVRYSRPREEISIRVLINRDTLDGMGETIAALKTGTDDTEKKGECAGPLPAPSHQRRYERSHVLGAPGGGPRTWEQPKPQVSDHGLVIHAVMPVRR
jgi:site-specific DNA recombinase